jgi:hypothetical protein
MIKAFKFIFDLCPVTFFRSLKKSSNYWTHILDYRSLIKASNSAVEKVEFEIDIRK